MVRSTGVMSLELYLHLCCDIKDEQDQPFNLYHYQHLMSCN